MVSPSKIESFARTTGLAVVLLGLSVLMGWLFGIETLKRVAPGLTPMKANAALGFVLSGMALALLAPPSPSWKRLAVGRALAAAVAVIGVVTLVEFVLNVDLGIDQILFEPAPEDSSGSPLGRMSPASALNFVLLGAAFICLGKRSPAGFCPSQYGATAAAGVTFVVLLGYLFSLSSEGRILSYTAMAVHAAAGFSLLSLAVLAARPTVGVAALLLARGPIGLMTRRMMLAALLIPPALGWLGIRATVGGASLGFAGAVGVGLTTLFFVVLIVRTSTVAAGIEAGRAAMERRFGDLIEGAPNAIAAIDDRSRLVLFNRRAEELFGYARDEVLGRNLEMLVPERFRQTHSRFHQSYMAAPQVKSMGGWGGAFALSKSGAEIPVEINLAPVGGRGGLVMLVIRDLSEAIAVQRNLETAERNYRSIFENAVEGIFRSSPDGQFLMANPALANAVGYGSPEEFIESAQNVRMLYAHSRDRSKFKELIEANDVVRNFEFQFVHRSGALLWAAMNVRAFRDSDGAVLYYEGFIQDITARKRAEEMHHRLMQILDNTPDLVSMVDWKTRLGLYLNKAGRRMLGVQYFQDASEMGLRLPRPDLAPATFA